MVWRRSACDRPGSSASVYHSASLDVKTVRCPTTRREVPNPFQTNRSKGSENILLFHLQLICKRRGIEVIISPSRFLVAKPILDSSLQTQPVNRIYLKPDAVKCGEVRSAFGQLAGGFLSLDRGAWHGALRVTRVPIPWAPRSGVKPALETARCYVLVASSRQRLNWFAWNAAPFPSGRECFLPGRDATFTCYAARAFVLLSLAFFSISIHSAFLSGIQQEGGGWVGEVTRSAETAAR